tara:strand:+ start:1227 stop:2267 length:1041 start_codon:yes stop_codon:yes gene_type:complete
MNNKSKLILITLLIGLVISLLLTSGFGAVKIGITEIFNILIDKFGCSAPQVNQRLEAIWFSIRLPRVLLSALIGGSLSLAGSTMQGLFRNPLADPSVIGISSGAAMFAAMTIVWLVPLVGDSEFLGFSLLSITTFIGAALAAIFIFNIARYKGKTLVSTMLLAGIAINAIAGSVIGLLQFLATDLQLRDLTFWTLGSLAGASYTVVGIIAVVLIICIILIIPEYKSFNALTLGEHEAKLLGINTEKLKTKVIVLSALVVGVSVAFTGIIAFVGLVVPHIMRMIGGNDHRYVLPASLMGGALLLNITDTIARTTFAPVEIPIGVITSLIGAPLFLALLIHSKKTIQS